MGVEGKIIGVDLDGVCADFYGRMRQIAAIWFEVPIEELTPTPSYGLSEWGLDEEKYQSLHRYALTQHDLFETSEMIPGARKYLRKLSEEKARIRIITHRLFIYYSHQLAVSQTTKWLDKQGIPYIDLCFMKEKEQVGADIYVEDSPNNIENLRRNGHLAICFGNSTNTHIVEPRVESWESAYEYIHKHLA